MPKTKRQPQPTEPAWEQLRLDFTWPEQELYESVRPMVLFGQSAIECAEATGISRSTLTKRAKRFQREGIRGLLPHIPKPDETAPRPLLKTVRSHIRALKAECPSLTLREIADIIYVKHGRQPSHHTIARVLDEAPLQTTFKRRYPRFADILGADNRRMAIVNLHYEGWTITRIAAYLETTRLTVRRTLTRWFVEGVPGLENKPTGPKGPSKVTLAKMEAARKLDRNPSLGAHRLSYALEQQGIHLSPRTCGRILRVHHDLYPELALPEKPKRPKKRMPFATDIPHAIWSVDVRYLTDHQCADFTGTAYNISILDNATRANLASVISPTQDLGAYLRVLYAAIYQYGVPGMIVSDGGKIFSAEQAMAIYTALAIEKQRIEHRKPYQNYTKARKAAVP